MNNHPSLPGKLADLSQLADLADRWPIAVTEKIYQSRYANVHIDRIVDQSGAQHQRLVVQPRGAIAVLALDAQDRVLLVQQYRHPVSRRLLELPAGTLDVEGETALAAAQRELAEEADITASQWSPLFRAYGSAGYSSESWECFLASDLRPLAEQDRTERVAEEAGIEQWWIPFSDALQAASSGNIADAKTLAGLWALHYQRTSQ